MKILSHDKFDLTYNISISHIHRQVLLLLVINEGGDYIIEVEMKDLFVDDDMVLLINGNKCHVFLSSVY